MQFAAEPTHEAQVELHDRHPSEPKTWSVLANWPIAQPGNVHAPLPASKMLPCRQEEQLVAPTAVHVAHEGSHGWQVMRLLSA